MVSYILIGIIALILLLVMTKLKELRHHLFYKILGVFAVLFALSIIYVWITSGANLASYQGFLAFGKSYFSWMGSLFDNVGSVTGYAVKQEWGLNSTVTP